MHSYLEACDQCNNDLVCDIVPETCVQPPPTPQWDSSFEHQKHMFNLMDKKIFTILLKEWNFIFCFYRCINSGESLTNLT